MSSDRLVCYLIDSNPLYAIMAANSMSMLRRQNRHVPVRLLLVEEPRARRDDRQRLLLERLCGRLDVELVTVAPYAPRGVRRKTFFLNKIHWTRQRAERLLCVDADTFVFGDINWIFDSYRTRDVWALENTWIREQPQWRPEYFSGVTPLNAGILLFNNGRARDWDVARHARRLDSGKAPESRLIDAFDRPQFMDEFSLWLSMAEKKMSYGIFGGQSASFDGAGLGRRKPVVCHPYALRWLTTYRKIRAAEKLPPLQSATSYLESAVAAAGPRLRPRSAVLS